MGGIDGCILLLNVLLLVPLVSAMSGVEQLQTLAEKMNSILRSKQGMHSSQVFQ